MRPSLAAASHYHHRFHRTLVHCRHLQTSSSISAVERCHPLIVVSLFAPAASPSFSDPIFERCHRHQMPPPTASIEIHLRLPPPPSNAVACRQPLVTKAAAAWWESPVFMENEFRCCYALISWQGWGRQGRKPFYPSNKAHLPRNKCTYFEQRKLPKPRLSCCTKNHITARPSTYYLSLKSIGNLVFWGMKEYLPNLPVGVPMLCPNPD